MKIKKNKHISKDKVNKLVIVTHVNPDLDSCLAIWLIKRFVFPNKEIIIKFVSMNEKIPPSEVKNGYEVIYVDTGHGKYNHHNTSKYVCAASLVMKDFTLEKNEAIKNMVNYALIIDHGKNLNKEVSDFDLINVIEGLNNIYKQNPEMVVEKCIYFLDGIYYSLKQKIVAEKELEKAITFKTKWGKGIGITTSNPKVRYLAHKKGYKVFINVDPIYKYRSFLSPGNSDVDYSELYEKIKKIEPNSEWFLHSSKQLLLCGSKKAPNKKLSNLSLQQMINLLKE